MFGLLYTTFVGISKLFYNIGYKIKEENNKKSCIERGEITYCDNRGATRLCSTGEYVRVETINGDVCLTGKNHRIIRNNSQNKRERCIKENKKLALKKGFSIYCKYLRPNRFGGFNEEFWYEDMKTGREMIVIQIGNPLPCFYVDPNTFELIRPTFHTIQATKEVYESWDKYIKNNNPHGAGYDSLRKQISCLNQPDMIEEIYKNEIKIYKERKENFELFKLFYGKKFFKDLNIPNINMY